VDVVSVSHAEAKTRAEANLAQIEAWRPADDFGRRMKALNVSQARRYIDDQRRHIASTST
jgi:hypothetical protein